MSKTFVVEAVSLRHVRILWKGRYTLKVLCSRPFCCAVWLLGCRRTMGKISRAYRGAVVFWCTACLVHIKVKKEICTVQSGCVTFCMITMGDLRKQAAEISQLSQQYTVIRRASGTTLFHSNKPVKCTNTGISNSRNPRGRIKSCRFVNKIHVTVFHPMHRSRTAFEYPIPARLGNVGRKKNHRSYFDYFLLFSSLSLFFFFFFFFFSFSFSLVFCFDE